MAFTVTSTPKVKASTPKGAPLVKGPATGRLAALLEQERDLLGVGPVTEDVYESLDTAYKEAHPKAVVEDTVQGTFTSADNVAVDKRVAADIYNDQQWTPYILGQRREEAYVDPELDQEQEKADLEEFAYRINVSPEDVAQDPALYEQFGRHLGKKYRVLNKDKYFEYNDEGGQPPNAQRIPTPWVQPRHVSKNTVHDVEGFMFEKQNPTTEEEFAYNAGLRVYDALQNTLNKVAYGPSVQSKIHAKAVEESGNTAEDMAHFVNKFVASYASLAEHDIDVGKAWSDIMLHSVLAYYKGNHWRSVLRNKDIETGKELDAESEFRGGVAGDQEIGHMVLSSMGVEKSTNKEKALAGSLSRNIVTDVFSKNVGNNMWEEKLFEISALDTDGYKNPRVEALTQHGIQISLRVQDLTSEIVPSSIRDVRTNTITPTLKDAIPRKTRGTKNIEYGNLQQQLENLHIQSNTMFSIHTPTVNVLNAIMGNIRAIPLLDGPAYLGIKGDGSAFEDAKGTMGQRKGFHYKRNYKGQLLNKNDEVVNDYNLAERVSDVSDLIKDKAFNNELQWAIEKSKLDGFYYDYFYGLNNRLHVDQTIGNYQHSKLARAFLGAGIESTYNLKGPSSEAQIMMLKAGIMKKFGHSKENVERAAELFDINIKEFRRMVGDAGGQGGVDLLNMATEEGWASISAIAEAVRFQEAIDSGANTYKSGFLTEIDGLTNGFAHSAWQTGDPVLASVANLFSDSDFNRWKNGVKFKDAYELLEEEAKDRLRYLWTKEGKQRGFEGLTTEITSKAFNERIRTYNHNKFRDAIGLIEDASSILGRKFAKKPVMIFGYGAGAARIEDSVREFMGDVFAQDPALLQRMVDNGIDIEKDFIQPLGIVMGESVQIRFSSVKQLSSVLSSAADAAWSQDFELSIPTNNGFRINLGRVISEVDEDTKTTYTVATGEYRLDKETGEDVPVMRSGVAVYNTKKNFEAWATEHTQSSIKAASQITVMLNHSNDSININRAITKMHKRILERKGMGPDAAGNTAAQVFDAIFVTPLQAGEYANELNDTFRRLNVESSHVMNVFDALTFELRSDGSRIEDPIPGNRKDLSGVSLKDGSQDYKRRLKPEGHELARSNGWSTWDPRLDVYAFDWTSKSGMRFVIDHKTGERMLDDEGKPIKKWITGGRDLLENILNIERRRKIMDKHIDHVLQFFWDPSRTKYT